MNNALKEAEEKLKALLAEAKAAGLVVSNKPIISNVPSKTCPFYSAQGLVVPFAWTGRKLANYFGIPWKLTEVRTVDALMPVS